MLKSLQELLDQNNKRPQVISDCVSLLETEVNNKKGVMGITIRTVFASVCQLKEGKMLAWAVSIILDDFIGALEPYYQDYRQADASSRGNFADFLTEQDEAVTASLMTVTDRRRETANNKVLIVTYDKMRKVIEKNIKEAVPALGQLIQNYATCAK